MHNISVKIDNNKEDIRIILEEFWEEVSFNLLDINDVLEDDKILWYRVEVDGALAGYYYFEVLSDEVLHIHVCLRPEFRPIKDMIGNKLKKEAKDTLPSEAKHLIAIIPKSLPHVIVYALENNWMYLGSELSCVGKVFHMGIELDIFLNEEKH